MPPKSAAKEESRSRLSNLPAGMYETARRAIEQGLIRPERYGIDAGHIESGSSHLETVGNPVGLEAIVRMTGRPPMLIRNDRVVVDDLANNAMQPGADLAALTPESIVAVEPFIPSVGRVEFINHSMRWGGTGWVVDEVGPRRRRIVTNRHVAKLVARRKANGQGVFLRSPIGALYGALLDLREEVDSVPNAKFECPIDTIVYLADDSEADCALLEISLPDGCSPAPIPLAERRATDEELVATIGYPAYDDRNGEDEMRYYFGDLFGVKRFAPGLIISQGKGTVLSHDCTTLGGNSGSILLSLEQKAAVGLHFAGEFGIGNSAVSVETLKQLQTGRLFAMTASPTDVEVAAGDAELADGEHDPDFFDERNGYDPDFLLNGLHVPLPEVAQDLQDDLARPSDATSERPFELRYTNFGVLYAKARRTPRITAVNIDGENAVRIKRGRDKWFFDKRIDRNLQLGQGFYASDKLDRGHMVRREDPNHGALARQANDDTFHYTNAALQHSALNQGKTLWQGLENYILDSARTEGFRASVFTGPILRDDDPDLGKEDVQIPLEFWKVVVMPATDGGLHATAYVLSQGDLIRQLLEDQARRTDNEAPVAGFVLGLYRTFQVAISHVEKVTGLRFAALDGADPLARDAGQEAVDTGAVYLPVETVEDLVL